MPEVLDVEIRNNLAELELLSRAVDQFVVNHELPAQLAFELNLALEEVLTNVISYGYSDKPADRHKTHLIRVRGKLQDNWLTVEVEDDGCPLDPLAVDPKLPNLTASIADRPIGGLGIFLVKKLMDQLEYSRKGDKNLLWMKKRVPPPEDARS